ncbi:hypothetical protein OROGR_020880 [Orobanche gracilis]
MNTPFVLLLCIALSPLLYSHSPMESPTLFTESEFDDDTVVLETEFGDDIVVPETDFGDDTVVRESDFGVGYSDFGVGYSDFGVGYSNFVRCSSDLVKDSSDLFDVGVDPCNSVKICYMQKENEDSCGFDRPYYGPPPPWKEERSDEHEAFIHEMLCILIPAYRSLPNVVDSSSKNTKSFSCLTCLSIVHNSICVVCKEELSNKVL